MLLDFKNIQGETVKPVAMLILGDNGKFYFAGHFKGLEGLTLPRWSINEKEAFKQMKDEAKLINKEKK